MANERKGIQPVVTLQTNGGERADVKVGQPVVFSAQVEVPAHTGQIIVANWDFDGTGSFSEVGKLTPTDKTKTNSTVKTSHTFAKPGTYFVTLRAVSQRQGDAVTPFARIQNLARVRVVVK